MTNQHVLNFIIFWHRYKCVIFNSFLFCLTWYRNLGLKPKTNFISSVSLDFVLTWTHKHRHTHRHTRTHAHTNTDTHTGPKGHIESPLPALTRDENQNFLVLRGDCTDTDQKNKKYSVFVVLISPTVRCLTKIQIEDLIVVSRAKRVWLLHRVAVAIVL